MARATAKVREEKYTETVTKYKGVPDGVTLELSDSEAQALATVYGHIGGDPELSGRAEMQRISNALYVAGYSKSDSKYKGKTTGSLYFS